MAEVGTAQRKIVDVAGDMRAVLRLYESTFELLSSKKHP